MSGFYLYFCEKGSHHLVNWSFRDSKARDWLRKGKVLAPLVRPANYDGHLLQQQVYRRRRAGGLSVVGAGSLSARAGDGVFLWEVKVQFVPSICNCSNCTPNLI